MQKLKLFVVLAVLLVPLLALAQVKSVTPLTEVKTHSLGPQKLGNLPPVPVPPDNPQSSAKIELGKKLYFDTRLSADIPPMVGINIGGKFRKSFVSHPPSHVSRFTSHVSH